MAHRGLRGLRVYLEMIKFEHSIFALPFALTGMVWASLADFGRPWPGWRIFGLIVLAMVSCRSAAMAFNRIVDRDVDAENPRTKVRALPAGLLSLRTANLYFVASVVIFVAAAWGLNQLAFALSPVALLVTLGYSLTKRFTPVTHYVLGLSLGIAPAAAWIAVTGRLDPVILPLTLAVALWTAGFDIIYSLQDSEFDKSKGLRSLPETLGRGRALGVSRASHVLAVAALALAVWMVQGSLAAWAGVALAAGLLAYEQSLVKPDDLRRVDAAFFTVNGYVSIGFFLCVLWDTVVRAA
ncbi:MAG: putative 4-hydroxybenzoate polyprenyltransferase [Fimbriimonadaceae bacterium]|nr:putative 4-hydroxybenzoate polyprenyltransferase [Fimbriimonadaceae bacterium]QYK55571.1 MAG: putative 4-hydroxybenzoate polyprenyltransferase [Fimbriimonadaceae bacterium]